MIDVDKWVEGFSDLKPDSQIRIAKLIKKELEYNIFNEEKYDKELGMVLVEYFGNIKDHIKDIGMLEKIKNILPRFYNLPKERQFKVLKQFVLEIEKQENEEIEYQKKQECKTNGHKYSKWEEITTSRYEKNPYLNSRDHLVPIGKEYIYVQYKSWSRKCKRCGYVECVKEEPESVKAARIKKEKDEEIKRLEKRIRELKKR